MKFLEIEADKDHVRFLVQPVPMYSVTKLVMLIKSLTAREIFGAVHRSRRNCGVGNFDRRLFCDHDWQAR